MKKLYVFLIALGSILLLGALFFFVLNQPIEQKKETTQVGSITFEIASTEKEQEQGLSGRTNIPHDYGMLFVFPKDDTYGFWMKDMLEPIDILWLSQTGEIEQINPNVSPDTYPTIFYPSIPVRYVLEMKAGEAELKHFSIGTVIPLPDSK